MKADDTERYVRANRDLWNAVTPHHVTSRFYDVEGFAPAMSLRDGHDRLGAARRDRHRRGLCRRGGPRGAPPRRRDGRARDVRGERRLRPAEESPGELRRRVHLARRAGYPYFQGSEPLRFEREGSYAAPDAP